MHWAADPELFRPLDVEKESDVFFYGHSDKFRREWMRDMIGEPSRLLPEADFAVGGYDYRGDVGRARMLGRIPFNAFPRAIASARVNLNVTRRAHAETQRKHFDDSLKLEVVRMIKEQGLSILHVSQSMDIGTTA